MKVGEIIRRPCVNRVFSQMLVDARQHGFVALLAGFYGEVPGRRDPDWV